VDFTSVVLGGVAAVMVFLMAMYSVKRFFSKALTKKQMYLVEFLALLFSISLFLAIASPATQMHNLFFLVLAVFVIAMGCPHAGDLARVGAVPHRSFCD